MRVVLFNRFFKIIRPSSVFLHLSSNPLYTKVPVHFPSKPLKKYECSSLQIQREKCMGSSQIRDIHVDELKKYQEDKSVLIVDVREKEEIAETGILPGAINIPLGEVSAALQKSEDDFAKIYNRPKPSKDTPLIFSCRSGRRSLAGLNKAKELGYTNLINFAGGWQEWEDHLKNN